MADVNFKIKNGLSVGDTEVLDSSGDLTAAAFGTAALEKIDDQVNSLLTAGTGVSLSYDDSAGTLTINGQVGDITGVTAGTNLDGGGTSGTVTLDVEQQLNNTTAPYYHRVVVTVISDGGNKYAFDGQSSSQPLRLTPNVVYRFDQSDSSNASHPLRFSESADGSEMTDGYSIYNKVGTPGSSGSYTEVAFDQESNNPMYFYCSNHSGMGNSVILGGAENTDSLTEGSTNQYFTNARARSAISASGDLSYNSSTGVISFTNDAGDIESVVAGNGLSGGGTSGDVTLNVQVDDSSLEIDSDTVQVKASGITNAMLAGSIANDKLAGSIANAKLANSSITLNSNTVALGNTLTLDTDDIGEGSSNLYMTTERVQDIVGGMVSSNTETGIAVTYEDGDGTLDFSIGSGVILNSMLANSSITIGGSATSLGGSVLANTDALSEGSSNLYFTNERVDDRVNALIQEGTGITTTYDDASNTLTVATSITQYADANARQAISVTDSGGDGGLAYNNSTGVITYTGPSASEVRAHISGGTGVSISSGEVSIGQAVATNSNVQFGNLTLSGNLTVNGTTSTVSSTNTTISDALIELGNGTSGSPSNDAGLVIERGSSDNVFIGWDESADAITFGTGSFTGASTGNLTITPSAVNTGAVTITNATNNGGTARNIYQSTSAPTGSDGAVGDLWILYS
tara:strand:+ start:27427 stop:29484 length:2058 start_codon:yes stop_codon:yes gene_type:complete